MQSSSDAQSLLPARAHERGRRRRGRWTSGEACARGLPQDEVNRCAEQPDGWVAVSGGAGGRRRRRQTGCGGRAKASTAAGTAAGTAGAGAGAERVARGACGAVLNESQWVAGGVEDANLRG